MTQRFVLSLNVTKHFQIMYNSGGLRINTFHEGIKLDELKIIEKQDKTS